MKLSSHYNKTSIIITIAVLVAGGIIYYFAIRYISTNELDRDLTEEIGEVIDYVNINGKLPKQVDFDEDLTVFIKTRETVLPMRFFDTVYSDAKERKNEPGRAVWGLISLKGDHYKVIITESRESTEYLVQIIATITLVLMVGLVFIIFVTNRYVLSDLWKPFYHTLNKLKAFNISDNHALPVKSSNVDEFNELNTAVNVMASRVINDYQHLKLFTENASHEMMTPLAVITSKLDTLIQDETLKPQHYDQINDIYAAANKLSRLNQSLLLLMKIENNLIDDREPLSLEGLITQKLKQFQELILAKDIHVNVDTAHKQVLASKYLIDILLNNFFSNAIRHNNNHGNLIITLNDNKLVFRNSGRPKPLNDQRLFERFQKGKNSEGVGLGLTIAKQICNLYHWELSYSFGNSMHAFQITF